MARDERPEEAVMDRLNGLLRPLLYHSVSIH